MAPKSTRSKARLTRPAFALAFVLALAIQTAPARAADPLLMFMLGFAKNLIESAIEANAAKPASPAIVPVAPTPAPLPKAPAHMDAADLRALVDESFGYLTPSQRAELLAGLDKALSDPANAPYRDAILTQFVSVARQVSFAHQQLERLSPEAKQALAERFVSNYRNLAPEQQQALSQQLRARALPVPADLNDMMLSALASPQ